MANGPCGALPQPPVREYRPGELLIRLNDDAVTRDGFRSEILRILPWLASPSPGRIETLRTAEYFAQTISTGLADVPWQVNGSTAVVETQIPTAFWIPNFGDGKWVGATALDGKGAKPGIYRFELAIGRWLGGRGEYSLYWAGDNQVVWSITGGGSIVGETTGPEDSFQASTGAPRFVSGVFGPESVLTATVTNTTLSDSPMGLIVAGTAGLFPKPFNPTSDQPQPLFPPNRLVILPLPVAMGQPRIFLGTGWPGRNNIPVLGRELLPPYSPDIQEELRHLYVYFAGEPTEDLIRCLRNAPGVKFAERMPVRVLKTAPAKGGSLPGGDSPGGLLATKFASSSLTAFGDTGIPSPLRVAPFDWKGAIGFDNPDQPQKGMKVAILDGVFSYSPLTHGMKVAHAALNCLHPSDKVDGKTITEIDPQTGADTEAIVKKDSQVNPPNYFTALRNIRKNNAAGASSIRVVNISRGGPLWTKMERQEMREMEKAKILVVAAGGQYNTLVDFPAAYDTVLGIGGAERNINGNWIPWLSANTKFDDDVLGCLDKKHYPIDLVGPTVELEIPTVGVDSVTGTSYAAPIVAALCSRIIEAIEAKSQTPVEPAFIRDLFRQAASRFGQTDQSAEFGYGMVDFQGVLKKIQ